MRRAALAILAANLAAIVAAVPTTARAEGDLSVSLVKPGGGFLVTDARQKVPIELILRDAKGPVELVRADVKAGQGKATGAEVVGKGRVVFLYTPPEKSRTGSDMLDLRLVRRSGGDIQYAVPLELAAPEQPKLTLELDPSRLVATERAPITVRAQASGVAVVRAEASAGSLVATGDAQSALELPADLPEDAPSHVLVIAAAAGPRGWAARGAGLSVLAELRVSTMDVEPGHQLTLEGSENKVPPVVAAADGRTVIKDLVRYGANVRAFSVKGRQKKEIPISIPSGLVPLALAAAIPGQDVADGGTGPSIVVQVPPPPFGGEITWPELRVEGATLQAVRDVPGARDLKVLVLQRPRAPRAVTVLADGAKVASVPFGAAYGEALRAEVVAARTGERAAILVMVTDVFGAPADRPEPRARLESGEILPVERIGVGEYRVVVPAGTKGETGARVKLSAEIPPPKSLTDEPLELPRVEVEVELRGAPPAVGVDTPRAPEPPPPPASAPGKRGRLGLRPLVTVGFGLAGPLFVGGGVEVEGVLPILDDRLSLALGLEGQRGSTSGTLLLDGAVAQPATTTFGAMIVPLVARFVALELEPVALAALVGAELRVESAALDVGESRAGGGSRVGVGVRAGAEAQFHLGPGDLVVGVGVSGLGAGSTFGDAGATLESSVTSVRLDLGYRLWLF